MSSPMLRTPHAIVALLVLLGGAFVLAGGAHGASDLTVSISIPANLTDNQTFEVNVTASNAGPGNAGPGVMVQLYLDGNVTSHPFDFNNVAQGANDSLYGNLTALCGVHSLRAEIDETDAVPETNETNNNVTLNFTVKPYINVTWATSGAPGAINVTLSAAASHGCEPLNFTWVADGITQYGANVTYSPAAGPFSVSVTARGTGGAQFTTSVTQVISIANEAPSLALSLPSNDIQTLSPIGLVIEALDEDGTVTNYSVRFGNGNTTYTLAGASSYRYPAPGDYTITVNVTDNLGGTNGSTISIHVRNRVPTVDVQEYYVINAGQTVTLDGTNVSDPEGGALTFTWSFGDGSANATGQTATHTYAAPGVYTVRLNVSDPHGGSTEQAITVQVVGATGEGPGIWPWLLIALIVGGLVLYLLFRRKDEEEVPKETPPGGTAPPGESTPPSEGISGKPPSP